MTRRPTLSIPKPAIMSVKEFKRRIAGHKYEPVEMSDSDYREKYPAIMEAWERYQVILNLHKGGEDAKDNK